MNKDFLKYPAVLVGALVCLALACGDDGSPFEAPALKGPYLGQKPPGMVPEVFAPGMASAPDLVESNCLLWDEGRRLLVNRIGVGILEAHCENGIWTPLKKSDVWNPYLLHGISPDGKKMFFNCFGTMPDGSRPDGSSIFVMEKTADGWSEPRDTGLRGIWPSVDKDGHLYFTARIGGRDQIGKSTPTAGEYRDWEILPSPISSNMRFMHPCIALDGSFLIMDSEDHPHANGCELYMSFKDSGGSWTSPVTLGDVLPLKGAALARLSADGKYIFFQAEGDIYWIEAKIVEEMKAKAMPLGSQGSSLPGTR
jgi:hypothetical protein